MFLKDTKYGKPRREKSREYAPNIKTSFHAVILFLIVTWLSAGWFIVHASKSSIIALWGSSLLLILFCFDLHYRKTKAVILERLDE